MKEEDIKKLNIYEKLSLIENEVGVVEKGLSVSMGGKGSYKAVSERDVLDAIKPIEQKYRVCSYPYDTEIINNEVLEKNNSYGTTTSQFLRLKRVYRFLNIDNPNEYVDVISYGDGIDTGDKAPGKAMTYADKYALMKTYKLSIGDDLDKGSSPQEGYRKATTQPISNSQKETIKRLYNENEINDVLARNNIKSIDQLTTSQASVMIKYKLTNKGR